MKLLFEIDCCFQLSFPGPSQPRRGDLTGAEWDHVRGWLHSLRCHARPVGPSVLEALWEDQLNPADAVGKLVGAFVWLTGAAYERSPALRELVSPRTLRYLIEELVAGAVCTAFFIAPCPVQDN